MKLSEFLNEDMLMEDRLPWLKNHFKDKLNMEEIHHHDPQGINHVGEWKGLKPEDEKGHDEINSDDVVDFIAHHADPTKNKSNTQWLLNQYKNKKFHLEDHPQLHDTLTKFGEVKQKLAPEHRDINKHKQIADVHDAIAPHIQQEIGEKYHTHSDEDAKQAIKEMRPVHVSDDLTVHHLTTQKAAEHFGCGQGWCTAPSKEWSGSNHFSSYNQQGHIYGITNKKDKKKYQFHFESGQTMAPQNRRMEAKDLIKEMPELRKVKEFGDKSIHFNTKEEAIKKISDIENQHITIQRQVAGMRSLSELDGE